MIVAVAIFASLALGALVMRWRLTLAAKSARAKPGTAPTPAEAKIETERAEQLAASAKQAADEIEKVDNADTEGLADMFRDELLSGTDAGAEPRKPPH